MRLFVYGTLRQGAVMHGLIDGRVEWIGPARVAGRLLDLGGFPGLVAPEGGEVVQGDLFALIAAERERLLDACDRYEGASFRRETAIVEGPEGEVEAWLYRYLGAVTGKPVIAGGDFRSEADRAARRG